MRTVLTLFMVLPLIVPQPALACLWDKETMIVEEHLVSYQQDDLIAGDFVRHSKAFYEWRIQNRKAIKKEERTYHDYNDIAVSYDKLGQQEKAIKTIEEKLKRWPDYNRYESEANLGTFYIHSNQFEKGLTHIEKAIEINPDAHFGREIYQKLLVEYLIEQRTAGATLPLQPEVTNKQKGFVDFILSSLNIPADPGKQNEEIETAIRGVEGMMRFGHHDSPILLEALGDLLLRSRYTRTDERAAKAYLKASYETEQSTAAKIYRQKAIQAISSNSPTKFEELEEELKEEITAGDKFYRKIVRDEKAWIASGLDVEEKYKTEYLLAHRVVTLGEKLILPKLLLALFSILVLISPVVIFWFMFKRSP